MNLSLKRRIANKLAGVFTPSLLIVLITFTTYWLGPGSISDRVTIGITAFLAIIQSFASARSLLPPISYVSVSEHFLLSLNSSSSLHNFSLTTTLSLSLSHSHTKKSEREREKFTCSMFTQVRFVQMKK